MYDTFRLGEFLMRVIFDTYCLGLGIDIDVKNMVGVKRYSQTISDIMMKREDVDIEFCDCFSLRTLHSRLGKIGDRKITYNRLLYWIYKGLLGREKWAEKFNIRFATPVPRRILKGGDIVYFSAPFYSLPEKFLEYKNLKIFITIHDLMPIVCSEYFGFDHAMNYMHALKTFCRSNCFYISVSESTKRDFCSIMKVDSSRVFVAYPAADPAVFYPCRDESRIAEVKKKYGIPEGPYILAMSRLQRRKNMGVILSSFRSLIQQEKLKDLSLVLGGAINIGCDDHSTKLELSAGWCENRIFSIGYIDEEDMAPLYSGALVLVFPSIYEGFGSPTLEAMQCGTPVITSNTSSLPEVVGDVGIKVHPRDDDAISDNILKLYNDESLRRKMSLEGIERAKLFSWNEHVNIMYNAFNSMI